MIKQHQEAKQERVQEQGIRLQDFKSNFQEKLKNEILSIGLVC
jgi:hypothetical protein